MKKVFILAILIASLLTAKSQVSINPQAGFSTLKAPTIGLGIQYQFRHAILAAGFDNHISKSIEQGNLVWARIGRAFNLSELNFLEVSAGAGQHRRSSDAKSMNDGLIVFNASYVHQMASRPEAAVFASITGTQKFVMFTGGLRFIFGRQSRGCAGSRIR